MPSCCLFIVLDGLGDRAYASLGHRTPLQAANTPNLDRIAARAANGLLHARHTGLALPSEDAHFALFGYGQAEFPGRGYLEGLGAEIPMAPDDVLLLCHFVSVQEKSGILELLKNRPEAAPEEAAIFTSAVGSFEMEDFKARYRQTGGVDGILSLSGPVSPLLTDSDPIEEGLPLLEVSAYRSCALDSNAWKTARFLKQYLVWAYETLCRHPLNRDRWHKGRLPVNALVTQRPGRWRPVEPFVERWGLRGLSIASGLVYRGLGKYLGMDIQPVKDSADAGQDLAERLRLALNRSSQYEFIHVHSKAPDAAAHTKNPYNKVSAIESLDRGLAEVVRRMEDDELLFVITADHSTPSQGPLIHSGEPVPIMMAGPGMRRDAVTRFDEINCAGGALGFLRGKEMMPFILNCLDRAKLQGLMDAPDDKPFWPGPRKPFRLRPLA